MTRAAWFLLVVGMLQMAGDVLRLPAVKAIGAATAASPAPKVFSAVRGLETYSTRFSIEWNDRAGRPHALEITPELNARVRGPYNRRNVFGAVLALRSRASQRSADGDHVQFGGELCAMRQCAIAP